MAKALKTKWVLVYAVLSWWKNSRRRDINDEKFANAALAKYGWNWQDFLEDGCWNIEVQDKWWRKCQIDGDVTVDHHIVWEGNRILVQITFSS